MANTKSTTNPYPVNHPMWKYFGLGVLAAQGRLTKEKVGFFAWGENSPARKAFDEGFGQESFLREVLG